MRPEAGELHHQHASSIINKPNVHLSDIDVQFAHKNIISFTAVQEWP
jgi:hypothetical protein